jgi:hypothetical protein
MPRRSLRTLVCGALLGAALMPALPSAAFAQISVVGSIVQERDAAPGTSYTGTITVRNDGAETQEARVYQTDYRYFADGRTLYASAGSQARSNAAWVSASPARLAVPPGQAVDLRYQVNVPAATDSLGGSYWSLIVVEGVAPVSEGADGRRPAGMQPSVRYGVQVVTHIGATGAPKITFAGATARKGADGAGTLDVDLANDGDRAGRPALTLELYDGDGRQIAALRRARGLLYPGTSLHQQFALGALPAGTYRAVLVADAGGDAVFGAQYTLRF